MTNISKKYKLVKSDSTDYRNHKVYRIKALKDFGDVKKGDLGGYVKSVNNLSQKGNCWVYDDAVVSDNAKVHDNAKVCNYAVVCDNAKVYGNANVYGNAWVCDDATVYDNADVYGNAWVCSNAKVYGRAKVQGDAAVKGDAEIIGDAVVRSPFDYLVFKNTWSSGRYFTYTKSNKMWKVGYFYGTGEELIKKAYKDSKESGDKYKLYVELVEKLDK